MFKNILLFAVLIFSVFGCQPYAPYGQGGAPTYYSQPSYTAVPSEATYADKNIDVTLTPVLSDGKYQSFAIKIVNKTASNLKISWNDAYFVENGTANGGFMFEGVQYINRNAPKQDWMIFPKSTAEKTVYPNEKVVNLGYDRLAAQMGLPTGWAHGVLKDGEFGAYLKISGKGFTKEVKLIVNISEQ